MRVSLKWLADYVDLVVDAHELAELLTASGTAVDGIEVMGDELAGLMVGRVIEVSSHPSADRLSVCRVDIGGDIADIVCGAPNVEPGVLAPVALPGARLPDGSTIKETSIRGVSSRGMLLSEMELDISEEAAGIMLLSDDAVPGMDLAEALEVRDTVLDLEITPNRPDCLSMVGVAREVAALTGQSLRMPRFELKEGNEPAEKEVEVEILDGDLCSRYVARVIDGLNIDVSPWWMRRRLRAAGIRPISNVVDVTNYVMLELGQPLHAFDFDLVTDGHIIVRRARAGESMTTLDGLQRKLGTDDLLICDPSGPVALAGVMGGEHTEVGGNTVKVLLESAHFDAPNIMRTSRSHDLSSEASYRFERGVDPNGCLRAADRAAFLMRELAGGSVARGAVDARARIVEPLHLGLRVKRTGDLIGIDLSAHEAAGLLDSIEIRVEEIVSRGEEEVIEVEVPTFRPDLEREIDLVEEVARLYGYDRVPPTLPKTSNNIGGLSEEQRARRMIARTMVGLGMHEAITMAFISPRWLDILDPDREFLPHESIKLRNPISEETSVMRPSLMPGLLEAALFNLNRRVVNIQLFEVGRVFIPRTGDKLPHEPVRLGCVITGEWLPKQWDRDEEETDFYTAKGVLDGLASSLNISNMSMRRIELPFLHPSKACAIAYGDKDVGYLGLIHPRIAGETDIPEGTVLMELEVEALLEARRAVVPYKEIPRFPSVQIDLAVVVEEGIDAGQVEEKIREAGGELLREVRLFDLYRGEQLGEGEKSLAYSLTFYALDRTLREEEIRDAHDNIVKELGEAMGARLR